jgi:putative salt-induced outer membrane protein
MAILKNSIVALLVTTTFSLMASADVDPALKSMLETAIRGGDKDHISAVEKVAIATWPDEENAIKDMVAALILSLAQSDDVKEKVLAGDTTIDDETLIKNHVKTKKAKIFNYYLNPALWNGQFELGGARSTGNTDEQGISIGLSFKRIFSEIWEHDLDANFDYAKSQGLITKRKIVGEYKLLWKQWDGFYVMNYLQLEADKFSGYKYRITENIGLGYELYNTSNILWRLEGGPGIRYNKLYLTDIEETDYLARISNTLEMNLWKNIKLSNKTAVVFADRSITFDNKAQLSASINAHLAAKLTFAVKHDTGAPLGKAKTDTISRATIVYNF